MESHRKVYGFSDGRRKLEYNRCPMGARNSGCSMQRLMELVCRGMEPQYFVCYLDDLLIATPCAKTHLKMIDKAFAALERAGLKVNPLKCRIAQGQAKSLGFVLSAAGIQPDPDNLSKVKDWPIPVNVKQVRQFVGLASYYRAHIKAFAKIADPLNCLLAKDKEWEWGEAEQKAFDELKFKLLEGTATQFPDFTKRFYLKTDGSGTTVGAVLSQRDVRNKDVLVSCASQKLNSLQSSWAAFDKEFYALIWGVRTYSHYLRFAKFTIVTDSKPLLSAVNMNTKNDGNGKRMRWSIELSSYNYDIVYKKGKWHSDADALSRCPHADPPQKEEEEEDIFIATMGESDETNFMVLTEEFRTCLTSQQLKDTKIQWILRKMEASKRPENEPVLVDSRNYIMIENVLFTVEIDQKSKDKLARVVVPKSMIPEFLSKTHGCQDAGHPGEKRMFDKLARIAFWNQMRKDVANKVRTCEICQAARPNPFQRLIPVKPQVAQFPMAYCQADLLKIYPPSRGFEYILVLEDRYSKFSALYPVRDKTTLAIAKKFLDYITVFGCPLSWGTDNGGEFKSRLIEALCRTLNVKKSFSLSHHPQSNGQCERKNRFIIQELSKRIKQFGTQWVDQLKWIQFSYNSVPHTATKHTPHRLMFGREPFTPFSSQIPMVDFTGWESSSKNYFLQEQQNLERTKNLVSEYHEQYRKDMIKQTSKKGTIEPFAVGSKVLKLCPTETKHKLSLNYDGPYVVKQIIGNTCVIEKDGKQYHRPQCDLKPYEEPKFEEVNEAMDDGMNERMNEDPLSDNDGFRVVNDLLSPVHLLPKQSINTTDTSLHHTNLIIPPRSALPKPTLDSKCGEAGRRCSDLPARVAAADPINDVAIESQAPVSDLQNRGVEDAIVDNGIIDDAIARDELVENVTAEAEIVDENTNNQQPVEVTNAVRPNKRLEREMKRLEDTNKPGLKQTNNLPEKRKSNLRR